MVHNVLEGTALVDVEAVAYCLVDVPVIDHVRDVMGAALMALRCRPVVMNSGFFWAMPLGSCVFGLNCARCGAALVVDSDGPEFLSS